MTYDTIFAVGNENAVHGWNSGYQDILANPNAPRFLAFELNHADRPVKFHNNPITQVPAVPHPLLDHQGHIIPQNLLDLVLAPAMNDAYAQVPPPANLITLNAYLLANHPNVDWTPVTTYATWLTTPPNLCPLNYLIDPTGGDAEEMFGGYFSLMMWNPVNICRAPSDAHRGGKPGNTIDTEVINYIVANSAQAGIMLNANMAAAFNAINAYIIIHGPPLNIMALEAFISSCNLELLGMMPGTEGFYTFSWQDDPANPGVLIPGP